MRVAAMSLVVLFAFSARGEWPRPPADWWTRPETRPRAAPEAEADIEVAMTWVDQGELVEAADAFLSAISHDPSANMAWRAMRILKGDPDVWRPQQRLFRELPGLDSVVTCGNPLLWPRFAAVACAQTYVRFATELDARDRPVDAERYRTVASRMLVFHASDALDDGANACARRFLSLSDSIFPFESEDDSVRFDAFRYSAMAAYNDGDYLQAIDVMEHIAEPRSWSKEDRRIVSAIAAAVLLDVSWDDSGLPRTMDLDDFFDSRAAGYIREKFAPKPSPRVHGKPMPYGMISADEDYATLGEIWMCKCDDFDKTIDARLDSRNLELPVKAALRVAEVVSRRPADDGIYPGQMQQLLALLDRIGAAVDGDPPIEERTLVAYDIARRIAAMTQRVNAPGIDPLPPNL